MFLSTMSINFSVVLHPSNRVGCNGEKAGNAWEEFENKEGGVLD